MLKFKITICLILFHSMVICSFSKEPINNVENLPIAKDLKNKIISFAEKNNRPMNPQEFQHLVSSRKEEEFPIELAYYLIDILDSTRPKGVFSKKEILDVLTFKRDSINSIDVSFKYTATFDAELAKGLMKGPPPLAVKQVRFAKELDKLHYSVLRTSGKNFQSQELSFTPYTIAYDGKSVFKMVNEFQKTGEKSYGTITENYTPHEYYKRCYWPMIGGLLGCPDVKQAQLFYYDLIDLIEGGPGLYVEPEYKKINGIQTVVVKYGSPTENSFYLDPSRGFCPIFVEVPGKKNGIEYKLTISFSDFVKSNDGVYLPEKIIIRHNRKNENGKYITYYTEEYYAEELSINEDVSDDIFTAIGVFENGTPISDQRFGLNYIYGFTLAELESLMNSEVQEAIKVDGPIKTEPNNIVETEITQNEKGKSSADAGEGNNQKNEILSSAEKSSGLSRLLLLAGIAGVPLVLICGYFVIKRKRQIYIAER